MACEGMQPARPPSAIGSRRISKTGLRIEMAMQLFSVYGVGEIRAHTSSEQYLYHFRVGLLGGLLRGRERWQFIFRPD